MNVISAVSTVNAEYVRTWLVISWPAGAVVQESVFMDANGSTKSEAAA